MTLAKLCSVLTVMLLVAAGGYAATIYVTTGTALYRFESTDPSTVTTVQAAMTLQAGDALVGLDFRPASKYLFGLGVASRLYVLDPVSGAAFAVGNAGVFTLDGSGRYGFDFNPVVDRIRVVSGSGQNFRLNPSSGGLTAIDASLNYALGDPGQGTAPTLVAVGYTNSFAGSVLATYYGLDTGRDVLVTSSNPNGGSLNTVGFLGVDFSSNSHFDITPGNVAFATTSTGAATSLYQINLASGAATLIGTVGAIGATQVTGMAIGPVPPSDSNGDGARTLTDVFYLINHLFAGGPAPVD